MSLEELERKYRDFYAPAFKVVVGGLELVKGLFLTITAVEVDLKEKTAGHFTFTVANAFNWKDRAFVARQGDQQINLLELFAFGAPVEIHFGYADKVKPLLEGMVTEVATSFSEGGIPELTISGYDRLYPLTLGKYTKHWEEVRDSDAVSDLVLPTRLETSITATEPKRPRIDQSQQTDMSLLEKFATDNKSTFYVREDRFYFHPRDNKTSPIFELSWGKGLLTFSPEANLAGQVDKVTVIGDSDESGAPIIATVKAGTVESGQESGEKTGGERVAEALGKDRPELRVRAAVHTQAEAETRAQAILEERSQNFINGSCESIGLPEIVPDINLSIGGVGSPFSGAYYVSAAKHKVDGSGYRTSFEVQETSV